MQSLSPSQTDADSVAATVDDIADEHWGPGRQLWQRLQQELVGQGADRYTPIRLASHIGLVIVVVGLLLVGQVKLPDWNVKHLDLLPAPPPTSTPVTLSQLVISRGGAAVQSAGPLVRMAAPFTIIPKRPRLDVENYVVQPGDTVFGIANKFGLQPETIMWSNKDLELNPDLLRVNDKLVILPVNGVYHQVKAGDTIAALAKKYKVEADAITSFEWNRLNQEGATLQVGQYVIVPGGEKPYVPRMVSVYNGSIPQNARRGSGQFAWPASGSITQNYWPGHRALDIGSWLGAPVVASDSGYVVFAGWDRTGYGNLVVIDHGNGYRTFYAHLSKIFVRVGESVGRGQRLGSVGSTGRSTGSHLHFEIRYQNSLMNPFGFLR